MELIHLMILMKEPTKLLSQQPVSWVEDLFIPWPVEI